MTKDGSGSGQQLSSVTDKNRMQLKKQKVEHALTTTTVNIKREHAVSLNRTNTTTISPQDISTLIFYEEAVTGVNPF